MSILVEIAGVSLEGPQRVHVCVFCRRLSAPLKCDWKSSPECKMCVVCKKWKTGVTALAAHYDLYQREMSKK